MERTAYQFAEYIQGRIEALSDADFHIKPRPVNKLIEELYPLSRLALSLQQPGLRVFVEAPEDSGLADGHIRITGFMKKNFDVQVTFAGDERSDALRSKLLVQKGFAPGAGPIEEDKKTFEFSATMAAEDMDAHIKRSVPSIRQCIFKKNQKAYPPDTVLVVAFDELKVNGRWWWNLLFKEIDSAGGVERGIFSRLYFFNCANNELHRVV